MIFASFLLIATIFLMELVAIYFLNNSSILTGNLLTQFRIHYLSKDRQLIQYESDCAIYDSELAYTLKPGKCHIKSREFEVDYFINNAGMRDDDASLVSPQIVVIGDSHAMGWGVNQDLIFSSLLEKKLGKPVLNTAVSSYGTVRELEMLERANLDNLEYLIIQYCDNDFEENNVYLKNSNKLPVMSEEKYKLFNKYFESNAEYYFGKHSLNISSNFIGAITRLVIDSKSGKNEKVEEAEEVNAFLNAVLNSNIDLTDIVVIVMEVNRYNKNDSLFVNKLKDRLLDKRFRSIAKNIRTIDSSLILGNDNYYILDDHMNSSGHHVIAETLSEVILSTSNNRTNSEARLPPN